MSATNIFIRGTIAVLFLAVLIAKPVIFTVFFNIILTLIAVALGSTLAIIVVVVGLNYIDKHHPNVIHLNKDMSNSPHAITFWKRLFEWCKQYGQNLMINLVERLSSSPIVRMQLGGESSLSSNPQSGSQNQGIYETIRPYGLTPHDLLASAYGPTAYGTESTTCVSTSIDDIMHRMFEYTYRDYVEIWYGKVSADHGNFHKMVRADYWDVVKEFSERLAKVDTVNLLMNRFAVCLLKHFKELKDTAKMHPDDPKPPFCLHPSLRDNHSELTYLRQICEYILILTLPPESAKISSLRFILREVLSGLAFHPMVESLCDPDYINQTIVMYLQRKDTAQDEQTRAYAYAATYEDFIKIINDCKSVSMLRQIRYRIMTEIIHATTISSLKKDQSKAGKAKSMDKGELLMNRDLKRYLNQCQVAKQQCERKIRSLGGGDYGANYSPLYGLQEGIVESQLLSFEEIMKSPVSRSYFMRYLKKIGKPSLLKFWSEVDIIQSSNPTGKELAKLVSHMFQTHVLPGSVELLPLEIDKAALKGMQQCVLGNKPPTDFIQVQKQVYELLEKDHYPSFVVSDIYIYQLVPEISDQTLEQHVDTSISDMSKAAFGSRCHSTDISLERLRKIEEKLEFKAQALESLKSASKIDPKVTDQLKQEILALQNSKWKQQLHIERTNAWWEHMGFWNASVDCVAVSETEGPSTPMFTIVVQCSGLPFYEATDDVSGWIVHRTLSEFHNFHHSLKECSTWLKKRHLPKLPMFRLRGLSEKFLEESKQSLDQYLQDIMKDDMLRCSQIVYRFLSPGPDATNLSSLADRSVDTDSSGKFGNIGSFLRSLPKDIMEKVAKQAAEEGYIDEMLEDEDGTLAKDSLAEPAYRLIEEIFELHGLFRFLRKSLIIFVRVAFGRSIDRQARETSEWLISEPMLVYYLQTFLDSMWPNGKLAEASASRTSDEKTQTKLEAEVRLLQNIPEALNSLVGHENARRGTLKVFHAFQNRRLNKHLFYTLLAETMEEVFPEILSNGLSSSA